MSKRKDFQINKTEFITSITKLNELLKDVLQKNENNYKKE